MQTIHFNTGRKYTEHGQRITATLHDEGRVTFYDHDRHIDGEFVLDDPNFFTKEIVLARYDRCFYSPSSASSRDATCMGGCNSVWVNHLGEVA